MVSKQNDCSSQIKIDCAIFSAMPEELIELENFFSSFPAMNHTWINFVFKIYDLHGYKILLTPTGIGTIFATSIITQINTIFKLDCMLFIGTAGGINDELRIKDIILVDTAFEAESQNLVSSLANTPFKSCLIHPLKNEIIQSSYSACASLISLAESSINSAIVKGSIVSSNAFPAPKDLFPKLKKSGVLAIDMETSAFYQVAWLLNIPCLAIRAISNKLDCNGHDENIECSDIAGSIKVASDYILKLVHVIANKQSQKLNEDNNKFMY